MAGLTLSARLAPIPSNSLCLTDHGQVRSSPPYWYFSSIREGVDDCDFNLHMSNSSYGKVSYQFVPFVLAYILCQVFDYARMRAGLWMFPMFFRVGGWMPLAGLSTLNTLS